MAAPTTAVIYVDERYCGSAQTLRRWPATLPTGKHRLTVQASGHFPHDMLLDLPAGESQLRVALRPIPP